MISDNDKVNDFFSDIQLAFPDRFEMIQKIRQMFYQHNSELSEDIKYGGLVFNLSNELVAGIFSYKNHISVEFGNGVNFPDPSGFLEGKGKERRHLKIVELTEIESKNAEFFIKEAVNP